MATKIANCILTPSQLQLIPWLKFLKDIDFVLYGWMAASLYYGHMQSDNFDFMSSRQLSDDFKLSIFKKLDELAIYTKIEDNNNLVIITDEGIKISLSGGIKFGRIGEPESSDDGNFLIASRYDLLIEKLTQILNRTEVRDYIDIAVMLKNGLDLNIALCGSMSNNMFSPICCLKSLSFFHERKLADLSDEYKNIIVENVKKIEFENLKVINFISNFVT